MVIIPAQKTCRMNRAQKIYQRNAEELDEQVRRGIDENHRRAESFTEECFHHALRRFERVNNKKKKLEARNRELEEKLANAESLIGYWADNCEAYRRTADHLAKSWTPDDSSEQKYKEKPTELARKKLDDVHNDPKWPGIFKKQNTKVVNKRKKARAARNGP